MVVISLWQKGSLRQLEWWYNSPNLDFPYQTGGLQAALYDKMTSKTNTVDRKGEK
jgi:hypothetical protein